MWHMAVENVGKEVVLIKDDKIFAKGKSIASKGNDWVSIKLSDEDFEKHFSKMPDDLKVILKSIGQIRVSPYTGGFLMMTLDYEGEYADIEKLFEDTSTVDHFNLRYGMVPEFFKTAEDYRSSINKEE